MCLKTKAKEKGMKSNRWSEKTSDETSVDIAVDRRIDLSHSDSPSLSSPFPDFDEDEGLIKTTTETERETEQLDGELRGKVLEIALRRFVAR